MSDHTESAAVVLVAALIEETKKIQARLEAVTAERDELAARCMKQEIDLLNAGGQLQEQDDRLDEMRRALAEWEAAADTLGPVGRPVD